MTPVTPTFAARVWLEGNDIYVELPTPSGEQRHTLCFPNDPYGLNRLLFLIRSRTKVSRIGEPGDITQHQLDKELTCKKLEAAEADYILTGGRIGREPKGRFSSAARNTAKDVLRKLGMI